MARFVGCDNADDVVFVRNTTEAANLLAVALPPGTRVLCSSFEHHANLLPWRQHRVTHLPFTTTAAAFLAAAADALEEAERAGDPFSLVAITGASNVTGEVPPVAEVARLAHARGALVFVDAAQLAPHRRIDLHELEADFLAFSGHKVYAPFGTGVLVSPADGLANGSPLLHGGGAVRIVTLEGVAWAETPRRYEAGTPNLLGAVALGAACDALTSYGMDAVAEQERLLASVLWDGLDAIGGVTQLHQWTDAPDRVGVAAFTAEGWTAHELGRIWRTAGSPCAPDRSVRIRSSPTCSASTTPRRRGCSTRPNAARTSRFPAPFAPASGSARRGPTSTRSSPRSPRRRRSPPRSLTQAAVDFPPHRSSSSCNRSATTKGVAVEFMALVYNDPAGWDRLSERAGGRLSGLRGGLGGGDGRGGPRRRERPRADGVGDERARPQRRPGRHRRAVRRGEGVARRLLPLLVRDARRGDRLGGEDPGRLHGAVEIRPVHVDEEEAA